jgi:hypothetical protein
MKEKKQNKNKKERNKVKLEKVSWLLLTREGPEVMTRVEGWYYVGLLH